MGWFSHDERWQDGDVVDNNGLDFAGERRLGLKLEHGRVSLRMLRNGATNSIELPEQQRGSAHWRPIVTLAYPGSVTLAPLPATEQW